MKMSVEIHYALMAFHLTVGFILVFIAVKAFKKTKYRPMALLALGFSLIVIGDTIIGDLVEFLQQDVFGEMIQEGIGIVGFIVLILAVKRS
mgnify:CR=1 FL=1